MPDIFFKCEACGNNLVADDAGSGLEFSCPYCNALNRIPGRLAEKTAIRIPIPNKVSATRAPSPTAAKADSKQKVARFSTRGTGTKPPAVEAATQIEFTCKYCHQQITASPSVAGRLMQCPQCGHWIAVPSHPFTHEPMGQHPYKTGPDRRHRKGMSSSRRFGKTTWLLILVVIAAFIYFMNLGRQAPDPVPTLKQHIGQYKDYEEAHLTKGERLVDFKYDIQKTPSLASPYAAHVLEIKETGAGVFKETTTERITLAYEDGRWVVTDAEVGDSSADQWQPYPPRILAEIRQRFGL